MRLWRSASAQNSTSTPEEAQRDADALVEEMKGHGILVVSDAPIVAATPERAAQQGAS